MGALRAHRVLRLRKKQCGQVLVPSTAGFSWGAVCCACWAFCAAAALIYPCTEEVSRLSAAQGADFPPVQSRVRAVTPCWGRLSASLCISARRSEVSVCGVGPSQEPWQFPAGSEPILLAGESRGEISPFLVAFLCPHTCWLSPPGVTAQPLGDFCATG